MFPRVGNGTPLGAFTSRRWTQAIQERTHTDTQTHRHTDTQTHRHTDTQTHRHTHTHTHTHTTFDKQAGTENAIAILHYSDDSTSTQYYS